MALLAALYGVAISIALPAHSDLQPLLHAGLGALWTPGVILCLQLITVVMFFFSGTSTITTGELRFGLAADWRSQAGCDGKHHQHDKKDTGQPSDTAPLGATLRSSTPAPRP